MFLGRAKCAVGTFANRQNVEHALNELNRAGFPMVQISVVAKDVDHGTQLNSGGTSKDAGNKNEAEEDAVTPALIGSMLGAIIGCLAGLGMLALPGIGFIVAVGISGTTVLTTLAGAGIGATSVSLVSVFASLLEIPSEEAKGEHTCHLHSEFLIIVAGTDEQVRHAQSIFSKSCSRKVWVY